jgi:hypothetical protein
MSVVHWEELALCAYGVDTAWLGGKRQRQEDSRCSTRLKTEILRIEKGGYGGPPSEMKFKVLDGSRYDPMFSLLPRYFTAPLF